MGVWIKRSSAVLGVAVVLCLLGRAEAVEKPIGKAPGAQVIRLGTLAPKSSPWGEVLQRWQKTVAAVSGDALTLEISYNGTAGDEGAMVGKIKSGQLDGAAITAAGLSKIYKPIAALQMPGLFASWRQLDAAREDLSPELEKGAKDAGFVILGWADVGVTRRFSKGFQVRSPADFPGKKPLMWRDDTMAPVYYQTIGGMTPVPLNIPEVLPQLNTGSVNLVEAPALVAEQLQWASRLDTVSGEAIAFEIGALVVCEKSLLALPSDLRAILTETAREAAAALLKRIRTDDDAAFTRLRAKMIVVEPSAGDLDKMRAVYAATRKRLSEGTFPPEIVERLESFSK